MIVSYLGTDYECSPEYSRQDFTGQDLSLELLNGLTIYGSCFSHEVPDSIVFPSGMAGVTLINCNLDNVYIPSGNTIIGGSHRRFKAQEDGLDWIVDENNAPVRPL